MRDWLKCFVLALVSVAVSAATPGLRDCPHAGSSAVALHRADCPHVLPSSPNDTPSHTPSDDGNCCAICQMDVDSSAIYSTSGTSLALPERSSSTILRIAEASLPSQRLNISANQPRAPPYSA